MKINKFDFEYYLNKYYYNSYIPIIYYIYNNKTKEYDEILVTEKYPNELPDKAVVYIKSFDNLQDINIYDFNKILDECYNSKYEFIKNFTDNYDLEESTAYMVTVLKDVTTRKFVAFEWLDFGSDGSDIKDFTLYKAASYTIPVTRYKIIKE